MNNKNIFTINLFICFLFFTYAKSQYLPTRIEPTDSLTYFTVFADGNIKKITTSDNNNTTSTGAIGLTVQKNKTLVSGQINIASSLDTIQQSIDMLILNPGAGKALETGKFDFKQYDIFKLLKLDFGIHGYIYTSKSRWVYKDSSITVITSGLGLKVFTDFINHKTSDENDIVFGGDAGFAVRWLAGDFAQKKNEDIREELMNTNSRHFLGFELGMYIRFGSINARISGYLLYDIKKGDGSIPGITRGQIATTISIIGPIYSGHL